MTAYDEQLLGVLAVALRHAARELGCGLDYGVVIRYV